MKFLFVETSLVFILVDVCKSLIVNCNLGKIAGGFVVVIVVVLGHVVGQMPAQIHS